MPFLKANAKLFLFTLLLVSTYLVAHGTEQHNTVHDQIDRFDHVQTTQIKKYDDTYINVNTQYINTIKPIFEKSVLTAMQMQQSILGIMLSRELNR